MMGMRNLLALHAPLAVSLPGSKCSLIMCPSPRGAENQLARKQMLTQFLLTDRTSCGGGGHPNDRDAETLIAARAAAPE